jgi:hypothetical protein
MVEANPKKEDVGNREEMTMKKLFTILAATVLACSTLAGGVALGLHTHSSYIHFTNNPQRNCPDCAETAPY